MQTIDNMELLVSIRNVL